MSSRRFAKNIIFHNVRINTPYNLGAIFFDSSKIEEGVSSFGLSSNRTSLNRTVKHIVSYKQNTKTKSKPVVLRVFMFL